MTEQDETPGREGGPEASGTPPTDAAPLPTDQTPPPPIDPASPLTEPAIAPATPLVAWAPPVAAAPVAASSAGSYAGGPPAFTVGALLSDTFARYGADLLRLFIVSAVASGLSWLSSFVVPMTSVGSNPFARPSGFVDVSGLLGLASFVVGIVGSATTFALAEGGRAVPFGRAIRRGVERSGWLFLTSLLLGVAFLLIFLVALIPIALFAIISPILIVVPMIALFLVFLWAALRLILAVPANVADNLNSIEAIKLSWRITKPTGVWLRILGASFVLGLMVAPAALGALLLVFPALFSADGRLLLLLVPAVVFALFTPLSALLSFCAYRRLVPPLQPSWTAAAAPLPAPPVASDGIDIPPAPGPVVESMAIDAPPPSTAAISEPAPTEPLVPWAAPAAPAAPEAQEAPSAPVAPAAAGWAPAGSVPASSAPSPTSAAPSAPGFRVPRLGTAGKALIALVLAFDVAGIVAIPYGVTQMEQFVRDGFPGFPGFPGSPGSPGFPGFPGGDGAVFPGQVAFGTNADLDACTIEGQMVFASPSTGVEWIAALERRVTLQDEVFLRISRDGQELETTLQDPGTYDCLGSDTPEAGLVEGIYTYQVLVNGTVSATGALLVQ